jgi:hypothetical protein
MTSVGPAAYNYGRWAFAGQRFTLIGVLIGGMLVVAGCSYHHGSQAATNGEGLVGAGTAVVLALRGGPPAGRQLFPHHAGVRACKVFSGPGHWYYGSCRTSVAPTRGGRFG